MSCDISNLTFHEALNDFKTTCEPLCEGATDLIDPDCFDGTEIVEARPDKPKPARKKYKRVPIRKGFKIGRNEKCLCGPGLKFKKCCGKG